MLSTKILPPGKIDQMDETKKKTRDKKKFKFIEIDGVLAPIISSWEEEQEAWKQGYETVHYMEKPTKKKRTKKKKWLSGRVHYGRPDGIFEVK